MHHSAAGRRYIMFEITRENEDAFAFYKNERKAYPNGEYDCTFEGRFLIYHCKQRNEIAYIAIDMQTGQSSEVCHRKEEIPSEQGYESLIPNILSAIKYTGAREKYNPFAEAPLKTIDNVFRYIMPQYGYAVREEQIELSKNMYRGLMEKRVSICEAEVGTGKSLAYLVAAVCAKCVQANQYGWNCPITITTSSIELQHALVRKDIPNLSAMLMDHHLIEKPLTAVVRKGKEHYFCLARFNDYQKLLKKGGNTKKDVLDLLDQIMQSRETFDLDRLSIPGYVKERICVKGSCQGCKYAGSCRYNKFVIGANDKRIPLDFQITNHSMYLNSLRNSHMMRRSELVIVDEAHKLKEAARTTFGFRLQLQDILKYSLWSKGKSKPGANKDRFNGYRRDLEYYATAFFDRLKKATEREALAEDAWNVTIDRENLKRLREMISCVEMIYLMSVKKGRQEIQSKALIQNMERFCREDMVTWIELGKDGEPVLCCGAKNAGAVLASEVWSSERKHLLTSGTMSDGEDFGFFKQENGLEKLPRRMISEWSVEAPFDYAAHARLYIPTDMPRPNDNGKKYLQAVADRVVELVNATHGHTAVLFTSYQVLYEVHKLTAERLKDYPVICMKRSDKGAVAAFRKSKNGVLFASGAMWEGIDCPGDCLSSLIIVRLPFPIRSIEMERKRLSCEDTGEFINRYVTPEMLIKLRQGAGRLIRTETDTGVLSILDSRANESQYAAKIQNVLSKYPIIRTVDEVESFIKSVKPASYFNEKERE